MRDIFSSDVNNLVDVRNIYPEARGSSVGTRASAFTPYTAGRFTGAEDNPVTDQAGVGGGNGGMGGVIGKPLSWWFVLVALLVALMWTAQRYGSEGEAFKNVRLSVYNIVVISLAAMIGFGAFKVIFGRFKVPGLSDYVQAV